MPKKLRRFLKFLNPCRRLIISILLVVLFTSTVYAFNFDRQTAKGQEKEIDKTKLNPKTSSIAFKKVGEDKRQKKTSKNKQKQKTAKKKPNKKIKVIRKSKTSDRVYKPAPKTSSTNTKTIQVPLIIAAGSQAGSYMVKIKPGSTGLSVMKKAGESYGLNYQATGSGTTTFVDQIGSLKNRVVNKEDCMAAGYSWMLYKNNRQTTVGIGQVEVDRNDKISWKYQPYCYNWKL